MSPAPEGKAASRNQDAHASEIEVLAEDLVALVDEFEAALSEGKAPSAFAERLAQLLQSAERLI